MADTLEQLTAKLLEEQKAANKKQAADRQLQQIKDTNEINKQNDILAKLDTKLIKNLQNQLKNADKKDKELIESLGKQLKDAGVDKFMEATSRIESIEESQKFSKKVEAKRSKDMQRIQSKRIRETFGNVKDFRTEMKQITSSIDMFFSESPLPETPKNGTHLTFPYDMNRNEDIDNENANAKKEASKVQVS